jgi:hypothetical protein
MAGSSRSADLDKAIDAGRSPQLATGCDQLAGGPSGAWPPAHTRSTPMFTAGGSRSERLGPPARIRRRERLSVSLDTLCHSILWVAQKEQEGDT